MTALPHRIIRLFETNSTNQDALRLALAGEVLPLWVSSDCQTGGRGRAGRTWTSEPGNLHASAAIVCQAPMAQAGELALIAGVAFVDAIAAVAPSATARLKWPNDVLIDGAKAGGILVESTTARGEPGFVAVIGFGLNVVSHPSALGRAATSLAAHGISTTAEYVLSALADAFTRWLAAWDDGRAFEATIAPAWQERDGDIGKTVTVATASGRLVGRSLGIDRRGYLVLDADDGTRQTVTHGDVALQSAAKESGAQ
ncbi:MAG: biotin--[acetyl-CoA-carboxylase] ligase [Hyphomicrobium sp.]